MQTPSLDTLHSSYYEALGRVVVEFQALEEGITFALIRLTRSSRGDDIDMPYVFALSELSFKARLKLLRNYAERAEVQEFLYPSNPSAEERPAFFAELLARLKAASTSCEALEEGRNQLLHSVWRPSESEPERTAKRFELRVQAKRTVLSNEEVPVSELLSLVARIKQAKEAISTCSEILASVLMEKRENAAWIQRASATLIIADGTDRRGC